MAILIVFIIILRCVTLSKLRSWSRERKESQEAPITPRIPMETLIKIIIIIIIIIRGQGSLEE